MNKIKIKLWADDSQEIKEMITSLTEQGWEIHHILTASKSPVMMFGDELIHGYGTIIQNFKL